jgi:transposase-like protein
MYRTSSLSQQQREQALALFEQGHGRNATATRLGVSANAVRRLHERWKLTGAGALVSKPAKRSFTFEFKLDVVRAFLDGQSSAAELAREHELSSPKLVENWVRAYRRQGEDALRPKPKGRPPKDPEELARPLSELEQLRRDNQRLAAENAYLKKLRALREQGQR